MEVVCCSQGEVGEDFEVAEAVAAELEVRGWGGGVGGGAFEGGEVGCLDCAGQTEGGEFLLEGRGKRGVLNVPAGGWGVVELGWCGW